MMKVMLLLIPLTLVSFTMSCSHPKGSEVLAQRQSQSRARAAAMGADLFYNDPSYREDQRKIPTNDFFFKRCRIEGSEPYPTMNQWECSDAMR